MAILQRASGVSCCDVRRYSTKNVPVRRGRGACTTTGAGGRKTKRTPCRARREAQISALAAIWRYSPPEVKTAWREFALEWPSYNACGEAIFLTPYQAFTRTNGVLINFGGGYIKQYPPDNFLPPVEPIEITEAYTIKDFSPHQIHTISFPSLKGSSIGLQILFQKGRKGHPCYRKLDLLGWTGQEGGEEEWSDYISPEKNGELGAGGNQDMIHTEDRVIVVTLDPTAIWILSKDLSPIAKIMKFFYYGEERWLFSVYWIAVENNKIHAGMSGVIAVFSMSGQWLYNYALPESPGGGYGYGFGGRVLNGLIYATEVFSGRVRVFAPSGKNIANYTIQGMLGRISTHKGNIAICRIDVPSVVVMSPKGDVIKTQTIQQKEGEKWIYLSDISSDGENIYVADYYNGRVLVITDDGSIAEEIRNPPPAQGGWTRAGGVWIYNETLYVYDPPTRKTVKRGKGGLLDGLIYAYTCQFNKARGVCMLQSEETHGQAIKSIEKAKTATITYRTVNLNNGAHISITKEVQAIV